MVPQPKRTHLRNHGFLHEDRGFWRLSRALDINPSPGRARELRIWISEDSGPEMTLDALMSVIAYFRITQARAKPGNPSTGGPKRSPKR